MRLRWTAATDAGSGVAGYRVIVDGAAAASVGSDATSALVRLPVGRHSWQVVATDGVGNAFDQRAAGARPHGRQADHRPPRRP